MADEEQWSMCEDGCLNVNSDPKSIIYHPNLNVILVISKSFEVYVIDVNSGAILHKSSFTAPTGGQLQGSYLSGHDKLLLTDGSHIGLRSDYNGVLLLDSILQPPVTKTQQVVRVELPFTEAVLLHKALSQFAELPGAEQLASEVTSKLAEQVQQAQIQQIPGNKAAKWRCVTLEMPAGSLWLVFSGLAQELKRQSRQIPAMTVASALCERLNTLAQSEGPALLGGETNPTPYRALMFSEAARRATFSKWPHMNYKWALPDQMAQAGFYHQPNCMGDDRAMCFTCNVCLVCWEPTDEPWSEHERHSPSCPFVKGESTQNVPLSVSYATQPALRPNLAISNACLVDCVGTTSARDLVATSSKQGHVVLWNIARQLKEEASFKISDSNELIQNLIKQRISPGPVPRVAWTETAPEETPLLQNSVPTLVSTELEVTALCVASCDSLNKSSNNRTGRPCLVVGTRFKPLNHFVEVDGNTSSSLVQAMNYANQSSSNYYDDTVRAGTSTRVDPSASSSVTCLLVYDIQYTEGNSPENNSSSNNNNGSNNGGTESSTGATKKKGHSGTRQENNMYSESFLSTFLYEAYDVAVIEDAVDHDESLDDGVELHPPPPTSAVKFGAENCLPPSPMVMKVGQNFTPPVEQGEVTVEPNLVQCFGLPEKLRKDMVISSIHPTKDGLHLLVTLGVSKNTTMSEFGGAAFGEGEPTTIVTDNLSKEILMSMKEYMPNFVLTNNGDWAEETVKWAYKYNDGKSVVMNGPHLTTHMTKGGKVAVLPGGCILTKYDGEMGPSLNIVSSSSSQSTELAPSEENFAMSMFSNQCSEQQQLGAVLLYSMSTSNEAGGRVMLQEQPLVWRTLSSAPVETLLLPCTDKEGETEVKSKEPQGLAAIVCQDGAVRILDVASLSTVATAKPSQPSASFISLTYCNSLEQLCLCSDAGKLHFFSLAVPGAEQMEEESETVRLAEGVRGDEPELISPSSSTASTDLLAYQPLTLPTLRALRQLTRCANLTPCFTANAPACWSEMMQAQKQRRHPQHLQQGGEELHHTRTWRLQHESGTWDEHVFELTLPRSCCVGHVDVKFTLHSTPVPPTQIQVTLLKLNASGIGRKDKSSNLPVDEAIEFNFGSGAAESNNPGNPVTTDIYSHAHNTEVLCGPVHLASAIDLSGLSGLISLTSPALLASRSRTLLVHIKALPEPTTKAPTGKAKEERTGIKRGRTDWSNFSEPVEQMIKFHNSPSNNTPAIFAPERAPISVSSKKIENFKGCDWIHEVSVTIRRTCRTNIPNERSQRRAMLESLSFVEQLAQVACLEGCEPNSVTQSTALDVLLWVCSVQLTRYRGPQHTQQASQLELVQLIERWMVPLVLNCLLLANRTVAHKFAKLCIICSEGLKNAMDVPSPTFDNTLLGALLTCMPMVPKAESAGALRWFFMLLNRKAMLNPTNTGQKCMTLLQQVAAELGTRNNPSHMLLRTRFGLYGLPLEPEIFDMDPPQQQVKASSTPLSYATVASGEAASASNANSVPTSGGLSDLRGILSGTTAGVLGSTDHHMRGLLETQPLHFTCHAASDGTKLETAPTPDGLAVNSIWDSEGFAFPEPLSSLRQNDEENSVRALALLPWQQLLSPPSQQTLVIERMHSGARRFVVLDFGASVALTDLFIPACADLVSLSIDLWSIAEETDGQRLVVAADIGTKSLVMSDLQPPPVCRYLKVTTIGRYGMSTARCRIPVGLYYGHMVLIPQENGEETVAKSEERVSQTHQAILQALVEDAQCRHSLACAKLKSLVAPFLQAEQPSVSHLYHFLRHSSSTNPEHQDEQKIVTAYQECVAFQRQLSVVRQVLKRLRAAEKLSPHSVSSDSHHVLNEACTDKLRVMADCLLDTLLGLTHETGTRSLSLQLTQKHCLELFQSLCVGTEAHTQLAACSLLVRVCGHQHWWGDFLADSLVQLFGARQSITTFPQDRVFILLSYLGRKSLMGGARNSVLESVLRALGQLVKPLTEKFGGFVRAQLDLCLIGWLLLFLSSCLDACIPEEQATQAGASGGSPAAPSGSSASNRWTFIQGQEAMQKHLASWNKASVSRCYSRKLHKRLMHHSQQLKDLEAAKKAFHSSTQALSALSSQAATLSSKLEAALKAQEQFLKKTVQQHTFKQRWKELSQSQWRGGEGSSGQGASSSGAGSSKSVEDAGDLSNSPPPSLLPQALSLPVARGLVALILNMDFTCNADLFLLACKVLSGIVGCVRPAISLSTLLSEEQLLQLVRLAVWSDWGPRALWGGPWVSHAICCLLQDLLEVRTSLSMKSQDTSPSDEALETPQSDDIVVAAESTEDARDSVAVENSTKSGDSMKLPSLLESEDSELEDLLEDIWVRGRYLLNRKGSSQRTISGLTSSVSTAMDARLEYGVEWNSEVILRRMSAQGAYNLSISIASSLQPMRVATPAAPGTWDEAALSQSSAEWSPPGGASSANMLSKCFDQIFAELHTQTRPTSLEQALQLWHTLAQEGQAFDPSASPLLQLQPPAVSGLMAALAWHPGISLCTWTLAFQCLTLVANQPKIDGWVVSKIVEDRNFLPMLKRFLSGEGSVSSCGPMACQNLNQLLVRLLAQTEVDEGSTAPRLKDQLLQLLLQLVSSGGALAIRQGPLDAQCKLLDLLLKLNFEFVDPNLVMNFMDAVGVLVYWTIQDNQVMTCRSSSSPADSASNNSTARCFGGLFASVLGGEPRHSRLASWDNLICSLLTLATKLIQTPAKGEKGVCEAEPTICSVSQSDEDKEHSKLAGISSPPEKKPPTLADAVLQRHPSMLRFLSALAGCSGSTLAMVLGSNAPPVLGAAIAMPGLSLPPLSNDTLGEPLSVGDAVFNLLSTLAKHASQPELVLRPVLNFLSSGGISGCAGVLQLSEPLLWYILRVLSSEEALEQFIVMGGIQVICRNLVRSSSTLINTQPSLVSMVMQHLYRSSQVGASSSSKKSGSQLENIEGMLNFAPLGCISSSNLTTQPADTLLQSSPPHRRARTPAWSYHFYPDEAWVELTITLPCAILLKEVHLMPHLTSLATCPAAVAIEISREPGSGMLPVCPPLTTSGFTFVRLHLPTPEVAGAVLIRLYKPKDSSNIGLSQIRLLGSTTFGDGISSPTSAATSSSLLDVPDEELVTKSSLGWLRLLHFCIGLPTPKSDLGRSVVAAAAAEEGLLDACCALLLVPAPPTFAPSLERVLLHLGLHSPELGLSEINTLLHHSRSGLLQGCMPSSSSSVYSVVELLSHLCLTQDSSTETRVGALLSWLHQAASNNVKASKGVPEPETWSPCAAYVHAIAAILWASHEENISYDISSLVTPELFTLLYEWTVELPVHGALKRAVDCVLCSMCFINPDLFTILLQIIGLSNIQNNSPNQSKEKTGVYKKSQRPSQALVKLTENQLMSVAMACQSPDAIDRLLASGLPQALTHCILEWCSHRQISDKRGPQFQTEQNSHKLCFLPEGVLSMEGVAVILDFLADVCAEGRMRDWLGSSEGSLFWLPLLHKLCNEQLPQDMQNSESVSTLQSSTVQFFSRCCSYHPANQQLLSQVLCDVIRQQVTTSQNLSFLHGLPGFTRRLVLQLLLESERVTVAVRADCPLHQGAPGMMWQAPRHPRHGTGHQNQLLMLRAQSACGDVLKLMTIPGSLLPLIGSDQRSEGPDMRRELWDAGLGLADQLSVAAGVTARDKRAKDAKNSATSSSSGSQAKANNQANTLLAAKYYCLHHSAWPGAILPVNMTMAQLLTALHYKGESLSSPGLALTLSHNPPDLDRTELTLPSQNLATPLQVFAQMGGLALLAKHLPLVYPQALRIQPPETAKGPSPDPMEADWVKVEVSEDFLDDLEEPMPTGCSTPKPGTSSHALVTPTVPPHSLVAFGLFLRLPGYAEVLLRDRKKAQCLLRLVLGVSDDGEGGDIFSSPVASTLPTLPFQVLRELFDSTPLNSDDGILLRAATMDLGAVRLLLNCLAHFTHHTSTKNPTPPPVEPPATKASSQERGRTKKPADDKSHLYWAKGTGFGTGSTQQSWNVEQALQRQRGEEEYVTVLLQVLASFVNPLGAVPPHFYSEDESSSEGEMDTKERMPLPSNFPSLLQQSCLLPAVSSYLRNDSVLDMARHIPLYSAVLQLLRAMAFSSQLATLLLPGTDSNGCRSSEELSVVCLLTKMKSCVDNYASRLNSRPKKGKSKKQSFGASNKQDEDATDQQDEEGLAQLIPDIQETANLVQLATERLVMDEDGSHTGHPNDHSGSHLDRPIQKSLEERYLEVMRKLRFDTYEMVTECEEGGGFRFVVAYHFEPNMRAAGDRSLPSRVKRLAQETVTLATSLPLSYSSSVFVRCDADRLDVMKVLITGPAETPYANGCFEFDVFFPPDYPSSPMLINLQTTGHHTVRFNPNLYNDGKVCLSVLNTWHGRPEEKWNAHTSSFLQVLVSIQSLILVPEPYFNEPGYERSRGTPSGTHSSREYNSNIYQATVRWAMLEQLRQPSPCFREVVQNHFWMKRREIEQQVEGWIKEMEGQTGDRRTGRAISVNTLSLKRHYRQLKEELAKLKAPPGLEDLAIESEPEPSTPAGNSQGESSTTSDTNNVTMPQLTDFQFTPSTTSTPISAPSTPPTPTVSDETPEVQSQETSNAEATSDAMPPYDPKLVQHV